MVCNFNPEQIIFSHDGKYIFEGKSFFVVVFVPLLWKYYLYATLKY